MAGFFNPSVFFPGHSLMPIYWALGYHLCRWGYGSSNSTWDVVKKMRNYGIPQVIFFFFFFLHGLM